MCVVCMQSVCFLCPILTKNRKVSTNFSRNPKMKPKIRPLRVARFCADRRTDMTRLMVALSNCFVKAPKSHSYSETM